MKCFHHRDSDAIGTCKACSKGLCSICASDVGNGLACRDQCEDQVRSVNLLVERNIRISAVSERLVGGQPRGLFLAGTFALLAGLLFAVMDLNLEGVPRIGVTGMGVLAILGGVWQFGAGWRLRAASEQTRRH